MSIRHPTSTNLLRALAGAFLLAVILVWPVRGVAQEGPDLRFGLVNAYQNPEVAADLGAAWETVPLRWDQLQPTGPGQWSTTPALADGISAAVGRGRLVVGVLSSTPAWATDGEPGDGTPRGLYLPTSDPANLWAAFVRQTVSYYAARGINYWVIWDGQDIPFDTPEATWSGNVQDYYQLLKVAYVVAREVNPNAVILLGGMSGADPAWFGQFLDIAIDDLTAPANNYYFDIATLHSFYSPEQLYSRMQDLFVAMQAKGVPLKEVWVSQAGIRPALDPAVYPEDAAFAEHPRVTLDQQAAYVVQAYALGFAANRGARIAFYRLVDDLEADGGEAFGLLRADSSVRPAYAAYQLIVRELSGFVYARRVDAEAHPDLEYVRFTFPTKVTHIVWARGQQTATLVIPARSQQARLVDIDGHEWTVQPEGGVYRVAAGGAACDDPQAGCLVGGSPWLLVEEGLADPLNEIAPAVSVEPGGTPPTPEASALTPSPEPTATPLPPSPTPQEMVVPASTTAVTLAADAAIPPTAAQASLPPAYGGNLPAAVPLPGWLPFGLIGLGVVVISAGVVYYMTGRRRKTDDNPS